MSTVLVVSTFEAEFQPLATACAAGALIAADPALSISARDSHLFPGDCPSGDFNLCLVACQQYEGIDRAMGVIPTLLDRSDLVVAFGQYAQLNAREFLKAGADVVLFDEPERCADVLAAVAAGHCDPADIPGGLTVDHKAPGLPHGALRQASPARTLFPDIVLYPANNTSDGLVGNIELSRGCHHRCTYCSVFGAYGSGVALIDSDSVVADALNLAGMGIRHFIFIDAEFFNSRRAGIEVVERIAQEVGPITFEMTTRVDHILDYRDEVRLLQGLGLNRVTTALEFPSDRILRVFDKGVSLDDVERCIAIAHQMGLRLNPTFIPFTPWVEYEELLRFEDWLTRMDLASSTHPTSLQTRLLLFKGSPLLRSPWISDVELAENRFSYDWRHADERVEALWQARRDAAEAAGAVRCCVKC